MFSQQSLQLLNDFLVGDRHLDSSSIEQILLPPRTLQLYSQREELRKLLQTQLNRESQRISEDIDSFVQALQRLFEEIKKILVSKVMQCEFEFKEGILSFTQTVDRYLKESHAALIEDKKRNQYFSLNEDLNYSRTGSIDGVKDLANHRRQMEMADHALKLIRNHRKSHQVVEATEIIDSSLQSDKHVYQRSAFRRLFGDFRDEIIRQIEDMELFKDGIIVKKLNLTVAPTLGVMSHPQIKTQGGLAGVQQGNYNSEPKQPGQRKTAPIPVRQGPYIPLYQGLGNMNSIQAGRLGMANDSNFDEPSYVEALDHQDTENSILTRDRPINQKISSNPLKAQILGKDQTRFTSHPPPIGGMRDSLTANKLRKESLEERERNFREMTKRNVWSSQSETRSGHFDRNRQLGSFDQADRQPAPAADSGSWNFFESVKRGFFGTGT